MRRNMAFAKRLALRYRGASESLDDLLQVANIGLLNAVDRFDPDRGIPFTAFASPTILGELKRHFRDRVWTVRVPRGLHDRMADVDKAITELTKELQRSPSVAQIAERLELEMGDVLEVLEANHNRRPLSLDRPAGGDDAEEAAPSEWIGDEDEGFELVEGRIALDAALPYLDERERLVLRMRFVDDMTQSQIAERVGHSQMHVSRILRRALTPDPGADQGAGAAAAKLISRYSPSSELLDAELVDERFERAAHFRNPEVLADLLGRRRAPSARGEAGSRPRRPRGRA